MYFDQDKSENAVKIIHATLFSQFEKVKKLIEIGVSVGVVDHRGNSPIIIACENNDTKIAKLLLENGASLDTSRCGSTPLHVASEKGNFELVKLFFEKSPKKINVKDGNGAMALHWAINKGHSDVANFLIDNGANIDLKINVGTPLEMAVEGNLPSVVKNLLEKGCSLQDDDEVSPLLYASKRGYIDVAKILIDSGADINKVNSKGDSPKNELPELKNYVESKILNDVVVSQKIKKRSKHKL